MTTLAPLDRYNWEACLALRMADGEARFMPTVLYSLAQARFEPLYPFAIQHEGQTVGFLMYGDFGGICWINRVLLDTGWRKRGIAHNAVRQLIAHLQRLPGCKEIRASYHPENIPAERLFTSLGFSPINHALEGEVVARLG